MELPNKFQNVVFEWKLRIHCKWEKLFAGGVCAEITSNVVELVFKDAFEDL